MRTKRYIKHADGDSPVKRKPVWHYLAMIVLIVMFAITTVSMQGCSTQQAANQRAIAEWQTEGHHIYSEADGKKYFVRCANGKKYVGYWVPETGRYKAYGPMDICTGEEE